MNDIILRLTENWVHSDLSPDSNSNSNSNSSSDDDNPDPPFADICCIHSVSRSTGPLELPSGVHI